MQGPDLTAEALQGFNSAPGDRCPFAEMSSRFNAWFVGRDLAVRGRSAPRLVVVLDAVHVEADGQAYQVQEHFDDELQLVAVIPVSR